MNCDSYEQERTTGYIERFADLFPFLGSLAKNLAIVHFRLNDQFLGQEDLDDVFLEFDLAANQRLQSFSLNRPDTREWVNLKRSST
jgi:hypothetical protein